MDFIFHSRDIKKLYKTGKSKQNLDKSVIVAFFTKMRMIEMADNIYDLRVPPSNKFKKLSNSEAYSIRLNRKYRLEFTISFKKDSDKVDNVGILRISNHYES